MGAGVPHFPEKRYIKYQKRIFPIYSRVKCTKKGHADTGREKKGQTAYKEPNFDPKSNLVDC